MQQIEPHKHHYIPIFYSKLWARPDGKIVEFSRPYDKVKALRKHPAATGFERDLYALPALSTDKIQALEKIFLSGIDSRAAQVLRCLINDERPALDTEMRSVWARFILSLVRRHPQSIKRLMSAHRAELKKMSVLGNVDEPFIDATFGQLIQNLIDSVNVGGQITRMRWFVVGAQLARHKFLTSDRPVIMTNGIIYPNSHIAIPIGPRQLFVCTNTEEEEFRLRQVPADELVREANVIVTSQAEKYVYGSDDSPLHFVEKRLRRNTEK